jgi:phthiocerol/phenolphthiocerol synthesis type-I polyketide synthase C
VITIALQDWASTSDRLALLRSPTYAAFHSGERASGSGRGSIDLRALLAEGDIEDARRKVIGVIVEEIARVLHLPTDDISQVRPLGEIGLDSLMGLELAMGLQDRFGLDIPLSASTGNLTVSAVADQVIAQASSNTARSAAPAAYALAETHMAADLADVGQEQMQAVREMVEAKSRELKRLLD